jgi:TfoX/Sxy family transcriptional regulator of competence genes
MSIPNFEKMKDCISQAAEAHDLDEGLTFKPMFGGICAYLSGRVFASLSDGGLALKLPPTAQDELLKVPGARRLQYEPSSPPSKQYIIVPSEILSDSQAWETWFKQSVDHVLSLPAPKPRKKSS